MPVLAELQLEIAALRRFIEILEREQTALVSANVDALLAISEEKLKQAEQLNQAAQQRAATHAKLGIGSDRTSVQAWLASQAPATVEAWHTLIEAAATAQRLNQTNGKLIATHLQHNRQALNALTSAANQSAVYGADGQPRAIQPGTQRVIGKG